MTFSKNANIFRASWVHPKTYESKFRIEKHRRAIYCSSLGKCKCTRYMQGHSDKGKKYRESKFTTK